MIWTILIAIVAVGFVIYSQVKVNKMARQAVVKESVAKSDDDGGLTQLILKYKRDTLDGHIIKVLCQMDKTCSFYSDEDEASRELTTGLNLLGHDAQYHYGLTEKRVADIFVDNVIIEGKLNPTQSDVDRLFGQVLDYLRFPHHIIIVLYGQTNQEIAERI